MLWTLYKWSAGLALVLFGEGLLSPDVLTSGWLPVWWLRDYWPPMADEWRLIGRVCVELWACAPLFVRLMRHQ